MSWKGSDLRLLQFFFLMAIFRKRMGKGGLYALLDGPFLKIPHGELSSLSVFSNDEPGSGKLDLELLDDLRERLSLDFHQLHQTLSFLHLNTRTPNEMRW